MRTRFEVMDPVWDSEVHGSYNAFPVRSGEPITGRLLFTTKKGSEDVTIWRISPAGIEFIYRSDDDLPLGHAVALQVTIGKQILEINGVIAQKNLDFHKGVLVGVRFTEKTRETTAEGAIGRVRRLSRWQCHPQFFPTGTLANPGRFSDKILFSVLNISMDGIKISTSLRNKFLLKGLHLEGHMSLPMAETLKFTGVIVSSGIKITSAGEVQVVGIKFDKISRKKIDAIGKYIIRFGAHKHYLPSPKRLKSEGYGSIDASDAVEWEAVRTEQDYLKVLGLRRIAYRSVEGWPVDADDHLISDPFDERARILVGRFRDTIVATLRVCFHDEDDTFEEELYIQFPKDFPPRNTLVEASRAAIHPEFRGTEIFMNMMRYAMMVGIQAERRWFVQSTYDYLTPIYKKIGFKEVGEPWMHPQLVGRKMQMFMVDALSVLQARYGNPFLYNAMVPLIEEFISSSAFEQLSKREKLRLKIWKLSAPAFAAYTKLDHLRKLVRSGVRKRSRRP